MWMQCKRTDVVIVILGSKRACEFNTEIWTLSCLFEQQACMRVQYRNMDVVMLVWAASVHASSIQKCGRCHAGFGQQACI
jgi:hypothetical protein